MLRQQVRAAAAGMHVGHMLYGLLKASLQILSACHCHKAGCYHAEKAAECWSVQEATATTTFSIMVYACRSTCSV